MPQFIRGKQQSLRAGGFHDDPGASGGARAIRPQVEPLESRVLMAAGLPRPDHVVIVVEENRPYGAIVGSANAPYINSLANNGALFSDSFGLARPSQPNYLTLFSGSTQGISDNNVHPKFTSPNLYSELKAVGKTLVGYSQGLPSEGFDGASSGNYARKHNPVTQFTDVPGAANKPFTSFPSDYSALPTVSLVVPDQLNDMHDGSIQQGDTWLKNNLDAYAQWARTHNSLLIVQFDEDDGSDGNHIPTVFYGPMVKTGTYSQRTTHYNVLRTLEDMYDTTHANNAATATTITSAFNLITPPAAPTGFSALAVSSSQIDLKWTDASTNEQGFNLERSTDGINFTPLITLAANATSYSNTALSAATKYTYRIRSFNTAGPSAWAGPIAATTSPATVLPPAVPSGLVASPVSSSQIDLKWTDGSSNEDGFRIERSADAINFSQIASVGANATTYSDKGLAESTRYTYRVRAFNTGGVSAYTPLASAVTLASTGVTVTYQAESATLQGVTDETFNSGYTGAAYADYGNPSNDFIEWTITVASAGAYPLGFRYANGSAADRPLSLSINGTTIATLPFAPTGSWTNWTILNINAALKAGVNTIRTTSIGFSGGNVDSLLVGTPLAQTLVATGDAYVRDGSFSSTNFGTAGSLITKLSTPGFNRETYLQFDLTSVTTIATAKLRIFGALDNVGAANVPTAVYGISGATWSESTITWDNRPQTTGSPLATTTVTNNVPAWYEWDVANFLRQEKAAGHQIATLVLKSAAPNDSPETFTSREAATNRPEVLVT